MAKTENKVRMESTEIKQENAEQVAPNGASTKGPVTKGSAQLPVEIPEKLSQQQALQVLVDAARIAQSKGIFTLDDAELVNKAIKSFQAPQGPVATNG
jgi:ribosomal protein S7